MNTHHKVIADEYAAARLATRQAEAALEAAKSSDPDAQRIRDAEAVVHELRTAQERRLADVAKARAEAYMREQEIEDRLKLAWRLEDGQTIDTPYGRVQIRVSKKLEIHDRDAFLEDVMAMRITGAAIKRIIVDDAFLVKIHDARPVKGVLRVDTRSVAWTAPRDP